MSSTKRMKMHLIATSIKKCDKKIRQARKLQAEAKTVSGLIVSIYQRIHQCYFLLARHLFFLERDQSHCPNEELATIESFIRSLDYQLKDFENRVGNLEAFLVGSLDNINKYGQHLVENLHRTRKAMSLESLNLITVDPPPECMDKIPEVLSLDTEFKQLNFISRILTLQNALRNIIGDQLVI